MKKLTAILAVLLAVNIPTVHADTPKTMVIIDNGVDIKHPAISNNIVYEVCVAGYKSCPNGQNFMEGPGAATITKSMYSNNAWAHGTQVASAAVTTDPSIKIIEIRCASLIGSNGYIGCNPTMLLSSLNWISNNISKFNIGIVVSPLGKDVPLGGKTPVACNTNQPEVAGINSIISKNIPIVFPTGNNFNYTSIDYPACVPGVLAISSIDDKSRLALYANYSSRVDFASLGNLTVASPGGLYVNNSGTSLSIATFGANWLKIANSKSISYQDEYNLIKNTGDKYTNIMVKQNVLAINIVKALQ